MIYVDELVLDSPKNIKSKSSIALLRPIDLAKLGIDAYCSFLLLFNKENFSDSTVQPQSKYFTVRGQSYFSRLPKY